MPIRFLDMFAGIGGFRSGHVAVVAGAGPIGLATIECLKALGAEKIIVVQRKSVRQEYALRAGADILLEPGKDDVVAEIYRLTVLGQILRLKLRAASSACCCYWNP